MPRYRFPKGHKLRLGIKNSPSANEKNRLTHLGRKYSLEHRRKISEGLRGKSNFSGKYGEDHPRWIKDRSQLAKRQERSDMAYKEWRKNVWVRDSWKCRISNQDCVGRIEAHHILGWTDYPELRYDINNGITLCHAHHPRKRAEEKLLIPEFQRLIGLS